MTDFSALFRHDPGISKRAGEVLFEVGARGSEMYVVRSGEIAIKVGDSVIERVSAGGIVGEMALLDGTTRSASAVALVDSEVIAVDQKRFLFLVRETPFFSLDVMRVMAARLRAMNSRPPPV
jgi:CRP-like cAMP-binding protein